MRKAKAEKDNKKMARDLKAQKANSMVEKSNVVDRMRVVFQREKEVAVSDATIALIGDLRKSNRGVESLKNTLWKSEVLFMLYYVHSAKPSPFLPYLFFSLRLQVQNDMLVSSLVQTTLKINELEVILKKVQVTLTLTLTLTPTQTLTLTLTLTLYSISNSVESIALLKLGNQLWTMLRD